MANPDALNQQRSSTRLLQPTVKSHLAYTLLCALVMMVMFSVLRLALLVYNREMILDTPASTFLEAFANGLRFDLRLVVYVCVPLVLALFSARAMAARGFFRLWLTVASSIALFLGLMEMDFYREFHQRLNGLVFQYVKEDPKTVMSMLWPSRAPTVRPVHAARSAAATSAPVRWRRGTPAWRCSWSAC
jgi:phosphoglycerol transferase MdoB-like AlkP superfamily enzyme